MSEKNHNRKAPLSQSHSKTPNIKEVRPVRSALPDGSAGSGAAGQGQTPISCPFRVALAGVDTLHIVCKSKVPGTLLAALEEAKRTAQAGNSDSEFFKFGQSDLFSFNILRTGVKMYQYILTSGDVTLCFSTRTEESTIPNMAIQLGSIACQENIEQMIKTIDKWLKLHGIKIVEEKVSRIDLCADITISIAETGITDIQRAITRAEKWRLEGNRSQVSGIYYGKGQLMLRAYDKLLELQEKMSIAKEEFFKSKWGEDVNNITRIEFQVRREVIKSIFPRKSDFKTVYKFIEKLWAYLTEEWFRHAEKVVDRKNKKQASTKVSAWWATIQRAFTSERTKPVARKRGRILINIPALAKQAIGCLLSCCAASGQQKDNRFQLLETMHDIILKYVNEVWDKETFGNRYGSKMTEAIVTF